MEKLIDKLDQYDILNNLIPGIMYIFLTKRLIGHDLGADNIIEYIVVCYIFGIIISRFGSVCIEPLAKKVKLVVYAPYQDFIEAESNDKEKKVTKLSMVNNMYRSLFAMAILVAFTGFWFWLIDVCPIINAIKSPILIIALILLFAFSYRKQTDYVRNRVKRFISEKNKEQSQ